MSIAGVGLDLVDVAPLRRSLARYGSRILKHVFTQNEIARGSAKRDEARFFAECFAVKEAAFKAIGTGWAGALRWQDVERNASESRSSRLTITGEYKRIVDLHGICGTRVTCTSTSEIACAMVILI